MWPLSWCSSDSWFSSPRVFSGPKNGKDLLTAELAENAEDYYREKKKDGTDK
jgi:hypothetical protein